LCTLYWSSLLPLAVGSVPYSDLLISPINFGVKADCN
jgi:hypothetical protein